MVATFVFLSVVGATDIFVLLAMERQAMSLVGMHVFPIADGVEIVAKETQNLPSLPAITEDVWRRLNGR